MEGRHEPLPDDIEALKAALVIERGTDELSAGGDRLEKSATHLATAERGLGLKKFSGAEKKVAANR